MLTGNASYKIKPQHILEVVYSDDAAKKFEELESLHGKIHAYHGSRVENFHSILHNGLLSHMNKVLVVVSNKNVLIIEVIYL